MQYRLIQYNTMFQMYNEYTQQDPNPIPYGMIYTIISKPITETTSVCFTNLLMPPSMSNPFLH